MLSFIGGCLLIIDGIIAFLFFQFFKWVRMESFGLIGSVIIATPVIVWLIRKCIKKTEAFIWTVLRRAREAREEKREKREKEEYERKRQKEINRRNSFCAFNDGITESEFLLMAFRAANHIRRLNVVVDGPRIQGVVESQSGISTWTFNIDFNDYGHITGKWWITYVENFDSNIPNRFAELMENEIRKEL